jgi:hypothetical protein
MPIHGGAPFLEAALKSVADEQPEGIEFRLYDSGNDNGACRRIAERFAGRIDLHWQEKRDLKSWTAKTNLGVIQARAEHVAMLHQDDLWLAGHVAAARHTILTDSDAALSIAPTRFADTIGRVINYWRLPFRPGVVSEPAFVETLLVQNSIAIPSAIIRRDAWLRAGGMDETLWYTADWDIYLKLAAQGRVIVRRETTTAFRLHGGSLTMSGSRDIADFRSQLERVLDRHLSRVPTDQRNRIERRARASLGVNCALARASQGDKAALLSAALAFVCLGPAELHRYVKQSRILDRLTPRLRLAAMGGL